MKRFLAALAFLAALVALPALAQSTGTIRGKIVDDKGEALSDAVVRLEFQGGVNRKHETKSNKKGQFTQVGLSPGPYAITVTKEGFQPVKFDQRVGLGDPTTLQDIKMVSGQAAAGAGGGTAADTNQAAMVGAFKKGMEAFNAGDLDTAEAAYKEVLVKDPSRHEAYHNLGLIYSRKKDLPAAEAAFGKALELKPDYEDAYVNLANAYIGNGQTPKAYETAVKAAAANPQNGKLQYLVGYVAFNTGKSEEALVALKKAEAIDASNPEIHYYLGMLAVGQNNVPEAVARLEKYLAMNPTNAQNLASAKAVLPALKPKP